MTDVGLDHDVTPLTHEGETTRIPLRRPVERDLTPAERRRYARQIAMPEFAVDGQLRLICARVLVIGAGGLGSPVIDYLARAGVGEIVIVDDDAVVESNLHRQTVHSQSNIGMSKAVSAAECVGAANPLVRATVRDERLTYANVDRLVAEVDLVIDCTDNYEARYLIADATSRVGVPCIWGAVLGAVGQASTFWAAAPTGGVTLRDLYPDEPPATELNCASVGVLGPLCGIVASWMAADAIKLIVGFGAPMLGRLLAFDMDDGTVTQIPLQSSIKTRTPASASLVRPLSDEVRWVEPAELAAELASASSLTIVDVREEVEREIAQIDGSILRPISDLDDAIGTIPPGPLVVHCHFDGRARSAYTVLRAGGRDDVRVLRGGIDAWAREVDTTLARY
ncbi:HesA/MoeB/ThiF family protein [Microbacterium sp. Leaf288]|uniref:HesA/MoeB/ThiF family protein n=1 Tax=Microbacterium sp. Leaf288 TaxID=1736323 RepID=UPI000B336967|nr:HesA/MoeB/ThiF family protein [Microbacterium sp. Leaf288]